MKCDVVIVGAGLAGLTAARQMLKSNLSFCLLEATDRVGGRVKTDALDGFLLDRGFQVLLTAYPETQALLDYEALRLKKFSPGACVYLNNKSFKVADPSREPSAFLSSLFSPAGSLPDKFRLLKLRSSLGSLNLDELFKREERPTIEALRQEYGFSDKIIRNFLQPFFAGIFLEKGLETSRRAFDFVFKMFGEGYAAIPEKGMEEIPKQLARPIPADAMYFNTRVSRTEDGKVYTEDGKEFEGKYVLLATDAPSLHQISGYSCKVTYRSTSCVYFSARQKPYKEPLISLNASGKGLINNVAVMDNLSPAYAPEGKSLISVSVAGDGGLHQERLEDSLQKELVHMYGEQASQWEHLKTYHIEYALPAQNHVQHEIAPAMQQISDRNFMCGDHLLNGSINAAMRSGRLAAELIAERLRG